MGDSRVPPDWLVCEDEPNAVQHRRGLRLRGDDLEHAIRKAWIYWESSSGMTRVEYETGRDAVDFLKKWFWDNGTLALTTMSEEADEILMRTQTEVEGAKQ